MDLVHDRGSMDPVQRGGPWTPGPCFVLTHNELGFVRFSSMTSNFLDNTCTKVQNMAFKTSQMDQIALKY